MTADFPTAPLASGLRGAGGGAVEKSLHASHTEILTLPIGDLPLVRGSLRAPAFHSTERVLPTHCCQISIVNTCCAAKAVPAAAKLSLRTRQAEESMYIGEVRSELNGRTVSDEVVRNAKILVDSHLCDPLHGMRSKAQRLDAGLLR